METEEERQNPPKQTELQAIVGKGEEDRISALPDCLLLEILSRLSFTHDAVRTGILSKRWKHLWTSVSTLIFDDFFYNIPWSDFVSFVDKTLIQCRLLKLKKFELSISCDIRSVSQVNNWIRYAIRRNVEELTLKLWNKNWEAEFELDNIFFIGSCFTHLTLTLEYRKFNPTGPISWKNLRRLCIFRVYLDEDSIKNILCGTPQLESLQLGNCYGYMRLDITSKSVKKLVFSGYRDPDVEDIIEINAPNILSLTVRNALCLRKLLLVNVSSLVKAKLYYEKRWPKKTTFEEEEEEMLKGLILNLRHVKDLKFGEPCFEVLRLLEAKGFVCPIKYQVRL